MSHEFNKVRFVVFNGTSGRPTLAKEWWQVLYVLVMLVLVLRSFMGFHALLVLVVVVVVVVVVVFIFVPVLSLSVTRCPPVNLIT